MYNSWTELHLETLKSNVRALRNGLAASTQLIFMVKSNAYGHGLEPVCRAAQDCGVRWFAVVHAHEAFELRSYLPDARILLMGPLHPSDVPAAIRARIVPVLASERHAVALADAARHCELNEPLRCHVKLDTGMGRLGLPWEQAADIMAETMRRSELDITGVCTHLASSSNPDQAFSKVQIERFQLAVAQIREADFPVLFRHVLNSGGILRHPTADFEGVRAGILLYGYAAGSDSNLVARPLTMRPCLQWKTRVTLVKTVPAGTPLSYNGLHVTRSVTRLAIINVGFADGFSRRLSERGFVLIRGRRCPVLGLVTMNMTLVDVGLDSEAKEWDEVVLIGEQGSESLWADETAAWSETIAYKVLTDIRTVDHRTV